MARTDKRDNLQVSTTPFAHVLTAYMWSKIPPWSANRLASQLGMGRARVVNWIYHNADPDLETMLVVMAQLNIPISALIDAYAARGVPIPPLTSTTSAASPASTEVPAATAIDGASLGSMFGHLSPGADQPTPEQRKHFLKEQEQEQERQRQAQEEADQQWQTMLTHTRKIMRMTGMKDSSIDAMLATLSDDRARHRAGQLSQRDQRIAEEFREQPKEQQEEGARQQDGERRQERRPISRPHHT